jgi:creatinine amidohydrolase/Fe(II)-dependent formamide hydrolase-like protein
MSKEVQEKTGYDHAGKWECSILSALYPETVDLSRMADSDEWFIQDAVDSSQETGEKMIELCVEDLKQKIK